jgi:hypothetical protein
MRGGSAPLGDGIMMYTDHWNDLPANERQFWDRLEECFFFMECNLLSRVETEDEALERTESDKDREHYGGLIRYRDTDDRENLLYFLENGRELLPIVRELLAQRKLSQEFFIKWADLNYCHGWVSNAIFSGGDDLGYSRAGLEGTKAKSRDLQRRWVARLLLAELDRGKPQQLAERDVARRLNRAKNEGSLPKEIIDDWLNKIIHQNGQLRATYCQKHFSKNTIRQLASEPAEGLPPLDF